MKYVPMRYRSGTCTLLYRYPSYPRCPSIMLLVSVCARSTKKHGISINTFYQKVKPATATLLLIEDWNHWVFGAYISEPWRTSVKSFYGTGTTHLHAFICSTCGCNCW